MKNIIEIDHPLVQHKLGRLRDKNTPTPEFRLLIKELSILLAFEATRDLMLDELQIETPMSVAKVRRVAQAPVLISIMRSGNIMLDALLELLPNCLAGHIGIYRDKFIKSTVEYYFKIPEKCKGQTIILLDPLLATGDTMIAAVDRLKQYQVAQIKVINLICYLGGVERLHHFHPEVQFYTAACETQITQDGYLFPGVGDAGDRIYGAR